MAEGHAEVGVSVLGVLLDDNVEVLHGFLVLFDHLVRLGSLVNVAQIARYLLDAARVRVDRLLELLQAAVRKAQVVVDVCLVCHVGLLCQGPLHCLDASLVLLESEVGDALLVEHLRVFGVDSESSIEIFNRQLVLLHIEVALCAVFQKLHIVLLRVNRFVEVFNGLVELAQGVVAAAESIVDGRVGAVALALREGFDGLVDQTRLQFRHTHVEMRKGVFRLNAYGCYEILNRILVIAHILVNETSLNVDGLVGGQQLLHLSELLEGFMEFPCAPVHQAQMEH